MQRAQHRRGGGGGQHHRVPAGDGIAGHAGFRHRRYVRCSNGSFAAGHRQRTQAARLNHLRARQKIVQKNRHLPRQQIGHRLPRAFVRHMHHVDTRHALEQLHAQMRAAAVARRRKRQLAGPRFRKRDKLFYGFHRQRRMHGNHKRIFRQHRHRRVIVGAVRQLGIQRRVDHMRGQRNQHRVTVRRSLRHRIRTDDAVGTRAVIHDHRLSHHLGHFLRECARDHIGAAAGRIGHDDADGFGGIMLCMHKTRSNYHQKRNNKFHNYSIKTNT